MNVRKSIGAIIMTIMVFAMFGCFNEKNSFGDVGKGVKVQRTDKTVVVSATNSFAGAEVTISGNIDEKNIIVSPNVILMEKKKGDSTVIAVAATGKELLSGDALFTIKNSEEPLNISISSEVKTSEIISQNIKRAATGPMLLGDFNGDNVVSLLDLTVLKSAYATTSGVSGYNVKCDIAPASKISPNNGESWGTIYNTVSADSKVDIRDFVVFANNFDKKPTFTIIYDLWTLIKGSNIDAANVTLDLNLTTSNQNDTITWTSSDAATVTNTGKVTRGQTDKNVTLTANASRYSGLMTAVKTIQVTVKGMVDGPTDIVLVDAALAELTDNSIKGLNTDLLNVTKDLVLPNIASNGVSLTWQSDAAAIATTGKVTQETTDKIVTLTVTATKGTVNKTKTFTATVKAGTVSTGITVYMEKPTAWSKIFIWYDTGSDNVWETATLGAAPGDMADDGSGWYKKVFDTSVKTVTFLFNDGSWANKFNSLGFNPTGTGGNFTETKSVWFKKDGTKTYEDPRIPTAPEITITPNDGTTFSDNTLDLTVTVTGTNITSIKYTTDGTDPSVSGTTIASGGKITIGSDMLVSDTKTIKVVAVNSIGTGTAQGTYTKVKQVVVENEANNLRIYQVMVSAFQDGDPNRGYNTGFGPSGHRGDLRGIINALPYIKSLGCNALWMTPIFDSTREGGQTGSTGYFANNYFKVDPNFGTDEDLKELIAKCHSPEYNMYIILDGVFGHYGGSGIEASPSGIRPVGASGWVDYPGSLDFYKEVAGYWIEKYEIDGWRLDQAYQVNTSKNKGIPDGTSYWKDIRVVVEEKSNANKLAGKKWGTLGYMVGEIWDNETIINYKGYGNDGLRSCFDFPLRYRIVQTLAEEEWRKKGLPASNLTSGMEDARKAFPTYAVPNVFLTNHDVARFGNLVKDAYGYGQDNPDYWKRNKAALGFIAAATGPITIYYGDEIGQMSPGSFPAPDNKSPNDMGAYMDNWSRTDGKISGLSTQETDLKDYTAKLMNFRAAHPALYNGTRTSLIGTDTALYSDLKVNGSDKILYILNVTTSAKTATIPATKVGGTTLKDAFTNTTITASAGDFTIPVDSLTGNFYIVQ